MHSWVGTCSCACRPTTRCVSTPITLHLPLGCCSAAILGFCIMPCYAPMMGMGGCTIHCCIRAGCGSRAVWPACASPPQAGALAGVRGGCGAPCVSECPPPPNTLMPAAPWLVACSRCACPAACGLTLVLATTLPFERTVATSWFQAVSGRAGEAWAQGGWAPVATSPCAPGLRRARTRAVVAVVLALMHF